MRIAAVLLTLAGTALAAPPDPCAAASSVSDVRFTLAVKDRRTVFQEGEIIPLVLSFASTVKNRYWADARTADRSGRLNIELYCVEPAVPDPLESHFKSGGPGGGMFPAKALDGTPFQAEAELNEWRRLAPGHYVVCVISHDRVWRAPEPLEKQSDARVYVTLRSNPVEIEVRPADPQWRTEQLRSAVEAVAWPVSQKEALSKPPSEPRRAARRLRFLNTEDSTRQLARLFVGLKEQPGVGWDLMCGLYGSPHSKDGDRGDARRTDRSGARHQERVLENSGQPPDRRRSGMG